MVGKQSAKDETQVQVVLSAPAELAKKDSIIKKW
jgi:hypothetical protein